MSVVVHTGHAIDRMQEMQSEIANCCVTSPPYFRLRDYEVDGQIGLEASPEEYVDALVSVFREVHRVLRHDGTLWLNIGDSYAFSGKGGNPGRSPYQKQKSNEGSLSVRGIWRGVNGLKPKDLIGIPWMLAFALRADGWWLRSPIIWNKPAPMPESVTDRPTSAHETIFLLSKSEKYFYDYEAVLEPAIVTTLEDGSRVFGGVNKHGANVRHGERTSGRRTAPRKPATSAEFSGKTADADNPAFRAVRARRNLRNVWTVANQPFTGEFCTACQRYFEGEQLRALKIELVEECGRKRKIRHCSCGAKDRWLSHFAVFPPNLIKPAIMAGCPEGGGGHRSVLRGRHDRSGRRPARPQRDTDRTQPKLRGDVQATDCRGLSTIRNGGR